MEFLQFTLDGLIVGSTYAAVAVGFALTFSALKVINLTHADIFMVAMFAGLFVADHITSDIVVVLLLAILVALALGMSVERVVLRPLSGSNLLAPMLATIGASLFIEYGMQGLAGSDPLQFPQLIHFTNFNFGSIEINDLQLVNCGLAVLALVAARYFVRRTKWGLAARAVAERRDVSQAYGVNVTRVAQVTIGVASIMAGIAGIGVALLYGSAWAFVGQTYMLKAFIAVLVAGNRHIEGVVAVAVTLALLESYTAAYVSSNYQDVVGFALLLVVLVFRPNGLFGSYAEERA